MGFFTNSRDLRGQDNHCSYRLAENAFAFGPLCQVFEATRHPDGDPVCVKLFVGAVPNGDRGERVFFREVELQGDLDHPGILPVLDWGKLPTGQPFLVSMLCPEGSLRAHIKTRSFLPLEEALPLLLQIADSVDYLHSREVVHGDIKPENILMRSHGTMTFLADFGISRHFGFNEAATFIEGPKTAGGPAGTTEYLAPEQLLDNQTSAASDRYSFALVAYELLVGSRPWRDRATLYRRMHAKVSGDLPDPSAQNPALDQAVGKVLIEALSTNPADRPASATALCMLLAQAAEAQCIQNGSSSRTEPVNTAGEPYVFISYASEDAAKATMLSDALQAVGTPSWLAEKDALAGFPYADQIAEAVAASALVAVLITGNANKSDWVARELDEAVRNTKTIVPIRLEDVEPSSKLRIYIGSLHWLDAFSGRFDQHVERVVALLHYLLVKLSA